MPEVYAMIAWLTREAQPAKRRLIFRYAFISPSGDHYALFRITAAVARWIVIGRERKEEAEA